MNTIKQLDVFLCEVGILDANRANQGILHESSGFMRDWHNRANLGLSVDLSKLLLYLHS